MIRRLTSRATFGVGQNGPDGPPLGRTVRSVAQLDPGRGRLRARPGWDDPRGSEPEGEPAPQRPIGHPQGRGSRAAPRRSRLARPTRPRVGGDRRVVDAPFAAHRADRDRRGLGRPRVAERAAGPRGPRRGSVRNADLRPAARRREGRHRHRHARWGEPPDHGSDDHDPAPGPARRPRGQPGVPRRGGRDPGRRRSCSARRSPSPPISRRTRPRSTPGPALASRSSATRWAGAPRSAFG